MHVHDFTVFTNLLTWGDTGIVFKNMHFETCFQKFAFSGPQNNISV